MITPVTPETLAVAHHEATKANDAVAAAVHHRDSLEAELRKAHDEVLKAQVAAKIKTSKEAALERRLAKQQAEAITVRLMDPRY